MKQFPRPSIWIVVPAILLGLLIMNNLSSEDVVEEISYSTLLEDIQSGQLVTIHFMGDGYTVEGQRVDGSTFRSIRPIGVPDTQLVTDLYEHDVQVLGEEPEQDSLWLQLLIACFPLLLIGVLYYFFMRQTQGRNSPLSFGANRAKLMPGGKVRTTFADVAGCDEAVEEVSELVSFLREPARFQKLGARIPRGVLLIGPPGTGKTLLAKAIAGEAGVNFFSISGSDFVEMFVGVGASRVRNMFLQARQHAPCIVFVDEIDAVGRHRGAGMGGGHDEREQTLNQLLVEMDGFGTESGIIVMAATNRPDVLDPALLRPGRFDRQVTVDLPDIKGRTDILRLHLRKVPMADNVEPELLARSTPGFTGADLENIINEAALLAARAQKRLIAQEDLERARDKVMMGVERHSAVMSEEDKRLTAYHEAGHAIVGYLVGDHDPVYKVSIIPRGRALGVTVFLPEKDSYSQTRKGVLSRICSLYGGRCAEELVFGADYITTGASNDIQVATSLARKMVTKWGLSDIIGPVHYEEESTDPFLGRRASMDQQRSMSDDTAQKIDAEINQIISNSYNKAHDFLKKNRDKLEVMAEGLMTYETLDSEQIGDIMAGGKPRERAASSSRSSTRKASGHSDDVGEVQGPAAEH